MIDPATALAFSIFENRGVYAVLLGSGVSRAAQIPTGWEVTLDLVRRIGTLQGEDEQADWAGWYRQKTGREPDYSDVLDALAASPDERRSILHRYIEPTPDDIRDGRKIPTSAHHAIAWLVREGYVRVILTTNFDRLMENALREAGVEPTVVRSDDDLQGAVPLTHSRCFLVKLHGDYLDTRIKNTTQELGAYSGPFDSLLDRVLDEHGLIVCGWSGDWDHALRAAIQRAPNRRYRFYWASRGALSPLGQDLLQHRRGTLLPIADADTFFEGIRRNVEALVAAQRPNVESTELLVVTAKQYLARPEHRIQLNDLLAHEQGRLRERLSGSCLGTNAQWSVSEFRRRVGVYEAAAERLGRVFGVMGRWGDGAELELASEIIRDWARRPLADGLTVWIDLQMYPAVLLLYAYGLGLLKAERYGALFKAFGQHNESSQSKSKPIVATLLLDAWSGGKGRFWQELEGLERRKTALSDHLHDILSAWAADYLLTPREFTRHFETFETLGALAFITVKAKTADLEAAHNRAAQPNFVWSPVGRSAWDHEHRETILEALSQEEKKNRLLKAGFAQGDNVFMSLAIESIRRCMAWAEWQ